MLRCWRSIGPQGQHGLANHQSDKLLIVLIGITLDTRFRTPMAIDQVSSDALRARKTLQHRNEFAVFARGCSPLPRLQRAHKMEITPYADRRMRKYLEIINHRTFIIVALCVLSVYMCLRLEAYAYNVDWIFLSIAVLFPLVFTVARPSGVGSWPFGCSIALKAAISAFIFGWKTTLRCRWTKSARFMP